MLMFLWNICYIIAIHLPVLYRKHSKWKRFWNAYLLMLDFWRGKKKSKLLMQNRDSPFIFLFSPKQCTETSRCSVIIYQWIKKTVFCSLMSFRLPSETGRLRQADSHPDEREQLLCSQPGPWPTPVTLHGLWRVVFQHPLGVYGVT